jgi:tetratricopeptide (TPR) repeat protein
MPSFSPTGAAAGRTRVGRVIDPRPLWDFDDPSASSERFLEAAHRATEPERTCWLTQYVRALGLQESYSEAMKVLDQLSSDDPEAATYVALERGRVLRSSGHPDDARPYFDTAAATAESAGLEALHVDALHMVALVALPEDQPALHAHALDVARAASDQRARDWDASLLNNLGMTRPTPGTSRRRWRRSRRRWLPGSGSASPAASGSPGGWSAGRCATSAGATRRSPYRGR